MNNELRHRQEGLTLVEIVVALALIGTLAAIVVPMVTQHLENTRRVDCDVYRQLMERAEVAFVTRHGRHSMHELELVDDGLVATEKTCRSGGIYAWFPNTPGGRGYQEAYGCSIHTQPPVSHEPDGDDLEPLHGEEEEEGTEPPSAPPTTSPAPAPGPDTPDPTVVAQPTFDPRAQLNEGRAAYWANRRQVYADHRIAIRAARQAARSLWEAEKESIRSSLRGQQRRQALQTSRATYVRDVRTRIALLRRLRDDRLSAMHREWVETRDQLVQAIRGQR